jgi:hypothetical protein
LGALTEYPQLLDDPDVVPYLAHASGALALGISVLALCKLDSPGGPAGHANDVPSTAAAAPRPWPSYPGRGSASAAPGNSLPTNSAPVSSSSAEPESVRRASDDVGQHLQSFPDELRPLVAKHVAAPEFDDQNVAKRVLLDNLGRIAALERKQLKAHLEDELRGARSVGDHDREIELLHELMQLGRDRLGQAG